MTSFIIGFILGALSVLAFNYRSKWLPWAKTEAQKEIDKLIKKNP